MKSRYANDVLPVEGYTSGCMSVLLLFATIKAF